MRLRRAVVVVVRLPGLVLAALSVIGPAARLPTTYGLAVWGLVAVLLFAVPILVLTAAELLGALVGAAPSRAHTGLVYALAVLATLGGPADERSVPAWAGAFFCALVYLLRDAARVQVRRAA
jgi:hypothetical protein